MLLHELEHSIFTTDVDDWRATYMPFSRPELIDGILEDLRTNALLSDEGFTKILEAKASNLNENPTFARLVDVANAIGSKAKDLDPQLAQITEFVASVSSSPVSEADYNSDCRAVLRVPNKDLRKLVSAATNTIYSDPCRRHLYGITIENNMLRLWLFGRSHVAVTHLVDFHSTMTGAQNPNILISFLLFIMFAPKDGLGFDPTVVRVVKQDNAEQPQTVFRYHVEDKWYETDGNPLDDQSAYRVCSRSTRVWSVHRVHQLQGVWQVVNDDPDLHVLKDVWLHSGPVEKNIQERILQRLSEHGVRKRAEQHFLTILQDVAVSFEMNVLSDGAVSRCEQKDITPVSVKLLRARFVKDIETEVATLRTTKDANSRIPRTSLFTRKLAQDSSSVFHQPSPRTHVRTVFRERCITVYEMEDLKTFAQCIHDVIILLWYLRVAGFIHQDVSAGNILWYNCRRPMTADIDKSGIAKVSDLEDCREYESVTSLDPKTGTPNFMSVEYQAGRYLYRPHRLPDYAAQSFKFDVMVDDEATEDEGQGELQLEGEKCADDTRDVPLRGLSYNFYHDLESVIWLYIWFVFDRAPISTLPSSIHPDALRDALNVAAQLFDGNINGNPERQFLIEWAAPDSWNKLAPLYKNKTPILLPFCSQVIARFVGANVELQDDGPDLETLRWPLDAFTISPYTHFIAFLTNTFSKLPSLPTKRLVDLKASVQPGQIPDHLAGTGTEGNLDAGAHDTQEGSPAAKRKRSEPGDRSEPRHEVGD
ncbi:hypothetical protein B0H10DRAFT_1945821 [Mycena sp. CBHHK59/15]|nr:hypothetical protein B0H10DRAFT_1945821 [Mycena sp. CBHHK59/15]